MRSVGLERRVGVVEEGADPGAEDRRGDGDDDGDEGDHKAVLHHGGPTLVRAAGAEPGLKEAQKLHKTTDRQKDPQSENQALPQNQKENLALHRHLPVQALTQKRGICQYLQREAVALNGQHHSPTLEKEKTETL